MVTDEEEWMYDKDELRLRKFRSRMLSKGELFKAMEVIDPNTDFVRFKDHIDLYTGKVFNSP